jgi:glycerol-3-phosphate acyltransferase PlsX
MGGDLGPASTMPACRAFLEHHAEARLVLVGSAEVLEQARDWPRCTLVAASQVVSMDDPIETAMRHKRDSSMRVAIAQLRPMGARPATAQACVSAGNTGALMAVARYVLKTMPGIERPAIAYAMPNQVDGTTTVLDLGANVDCTAEHLLQFAVMGSALAAAMRADHGDAEPSVGLLNIGEEMIKGGETIRRAGELLRAAHAAGHLDFVGNVEGNDIYKGSCDVVVCDGFVGNVMLKTSEGLATMITEFIRQEFSRGPLSRLAALVALPVLRRFKARVDPRRYNGAALLGLRGLVFKSHGSADALAFEQALRRAYDAARNRLLDRVHDRIAQTMLSIPAAAEGAVPAAPSDPARRVA